MTNTQTVKLWLSNTESLYHATLDVVRSHSDRYDQAIELRVFVENHCDDYCIGGTLAHDLMNSALQGVDWYELVDAFTEDVEDEDPIHAETEVVSNLVRKLTDDGCLIEVAQEGEVPEDPMTDIHSVVLAQLMHCDADYLYVYDGDKQPLGFIRLIYGQSEESPLEVISDYTASDYLNSVIRHIDN